MGSNAAKRSRMLNPTKQVLDLPAEWPVLGSNVGTVVRAKGMKKKVVG